MIDSNVLDQFAPESPRDQSVPEAEYIRVEPPCVSVIKWSPLSRHKKSERTDITVDVDEVVTPAITAHLRRLDLINQPFPAIRTYACSYGWAGVGIHMAWRKRALDEDSGVLAGRY